MTAAKVQIKSKNQLFVNSENAVRLPWQQLFSVLPSGIIVLDGDGVIIEYNTAAADILGLPLKGLAWVKVIHRCVTSREDDGHEVSLQNGRQVRINTASMAPLRGQLIQITDLTQTRALQTIKHRKQRLAEMGEMTAQLAHQIRTPLATAMLYADHLQKQDLPTEKHQLFNHKLLSSLHHISQQINDMLLFAKGGQGVKQRISVKRVLDNVLTVMDKHIKVANANISIDTQSLGTEILCHLDGMMGALQNLINNAIEASEPDAEIRIVIKMFGNTFVDIIVIDQGCGMSEVQQAKALQPFYTSKTKGTGLGLAVVQAVAKAHEGDVWLQSTVGEGTQVGIRLPIATLQKGEGYE